MMLQGHRLPSSSHLQQRFWQMLSPCLGPVQRLHQHPLTRWDVVL